MQTWNLVVAGSTSTNNQGAKRRVLLAVIMFGKVVGLGTAIAAGYYLQNVAFPGASSKRERWLEVPLAFACRAFGRRVSAAGFPFGAPVPVAAPGWYFEALFAP